MNRSEQFHLDGYVVIPGVLSPATCAAIQSACDRYFAPPARPDAMAADNACDVRCWDPLAQPDQTFVALAGLAELDAITCDVLGAGCVPSPSMLVMSSTPGGRGQAWHQDCPCPGIAEVPAHHHNVNRLFYVADIHPDAGGVVVMPGSHRLGPVPKGHDPQEDLPGQARLLPTMGTLVLLHGWCWHRVTPNCTAQARLSINHRTFPPGCPIGVDSIGVYRDTVVDFRTGVTTQLANLRHCRSGGAHGSTPGRVEHQLDLDGGNGLR